MATGGKREEVDAKIRAWESDLERLRLALAAAPGGVHATHHQRFVELYRQKEIVKSRWEVIRGAYQPPPEASRRFAEAFAAMEDAWAAAGSMRSEILTSNPT
jgi:hypothetical protein